MKGRVVLWSEGITDVFDFITLPKIGSKSLISPFFFTFSFPWSQKGRDTIGFTPKGREKERIIVFIFVFYLYGDPNFGVNFSLKRKLKGTLCSVSVKVVFFFRHPPPPHV